jgi:uncharacterized protein YifE (UPF0438 family)
VATNCLDHWRFVARHDYRVPNGADLFRLTSAELALVKKYGTWMAALERGTLTPMTSAQRHFLKVCSGEEEPVIAFAMAWKNLKDAAQHGYRGTKSSWRPQAGRTSPSIWALCPLCGARGEAKGGCASCDGTGWLHDPTVRSEGHDHRSERSLSARAQRISR